MSRSKKDTAGARPKEAKYLYDGMRRRICKIEKVRDASTKNLKGQLYWNYTYYTYDASGNMMAAYTRNFSYLGSSLYSDAYNLHEQDIYGSKRLGLNHNEVNMATAYFTSPPPPYPPLPTNFTSPTYETHADDERVPVHPIFILPSLTSRTLGNKEYEFTNHLSNVLTTTSDRKLQNAFGVNPGGGIVSYYEPDILTTTDYYPFGAPMAGRTYAFSNPYRYAMNGQEREPEALAGSFSAEYWQYDSRLGRRWDIDPVVHEYESPYATFDNNPIYYADPEGADTEPTGDKTSNPNGTKGGPQEGESCHNSDGTGEFYVNGEWQKTDMSNTQSLDAVVVVSEKPPTPAQKEEARTSGRFNAYTSDNFFGLGRGNPIEKYNDPALQKEYAKGQLQGDAMAMVQAWAEMGIGDGMIGGGMAMAAATSELAVTGVGAAAPAVGLIGAGVGVLVEGHAQTVLGVATAESVKTMVILNAIGAHDGNEEAGNSEELSSEKSINQLNKDVQSGRAPKGIKRFDKGRGTKNLPEDEVHFNDGSSLYRSGKWRHNKGHKITNEQSNYLRTHGWNISN